MDHYEHEQRRAVEYVSTMHKAMNGVENKILVKLYKTYVRPVLEYGSMSFLTANLTQLQKIQNDFIRLAMRLPAYLRTDLIHEAAGLEPIKERFLSLNCNLMKKILVQDDVQKSVEKSLNVIPLNNYSSPLDMLIDKQPDLLTCDE